MTDQQIAYCIERCSGCNARVFQMEKPVKVKRDNSGMYPDFWFMRLIKFLVEGPTDEHICTSCVLKSIENIGLKK